jgi:hypothetical protein
MPPWHHFEKICVIEMGLSINHLQRLADPFPGTPRHNRGTPNLSSTRSWHNGAARFAHFLEFSRKMLYLDDHE